MNKYFERVEAVRELMADKGWDAVVITGSDPHASEYPAPRWKQVEWLSGFTGEAGDIVITADHAGLWTDTRYFIEASKVLPGTGIDLHKTRVPDQVLIPEWLATEAFPDVDRDVVIAVDGQSQDYASVRDIRNALLDTGRDDEGVTIVSAPDQLSPLWEDRPEVPQTTVMSLDEFLVGESRESKLAWLRAFLAEKACGAILVSALDEIAWLLNVRGSDVAYNPVVISYLLVTEDRVRWFARKDVYSETAETRKVYDELRKEGVEVLGYDEIEFVLASLTGRLYTDPSSLNYNLYSVITENEALEGLVFGQSPVILRKAVKNETEIEGMREAHIQDGIAMEKFLYWLEREMESGALVSERQAADKLGEYRSGTKGYMGDSFETISAYGENAALPHYVTPADDTTFLQPRGLYLCDSGGQYLNGTTDITRTVPLGACSSLEKEDYTLVLKGHLALAAAVFPKGTAGCQIDVLARGAMWGKKRNFGHGTGHGVGFFLNVHEGPQDIRQNFNSQPILPGMITSDEPGIYREGRHGIRHENLLLAVDAGSNEFGQWVEFENLTLCHIDTSAVVVEMLTPEERAFLNAYNSRVYNILSPRLPGNVVSWLEKKTRAV